MKRPGFISALRITLIYVVIGGLWILGTDWLAGVLAAGSPAREAQIQTYKGFFYVAITALSLFLLLRGELARRNEIERSLRVSVQRYRQAVENSPNPIFSVDRQGMIQTWNPACERAFGYGDAIVGRSYESLLPDPATRARIRELVAEVFAGERSLHSVEIVYQTNTGEERHTTSRLYPLLGENGGVLACVFANTDITDRTHAEERLKQQAQRLKALHELDQAILAAHSPEHVAQISLDHLAQLIPYSRASVVLFNVEKTRMNMLAINVWGEATKLGLDMDRPLASSEDHLRRLKSAQVIVVDDLQQLPKRSEVERILLEEGIRTYFDVPLRAEGDLIGTLNVGARQPGTFNEGHISIAREVAGELAIAVRQARLFEAEQEQHALAEALADIVSALNSTLEVDAVLDRILTNVERVVPHDKAGIMLIKDGVARLVRVRGYEQAVQERLYAASLKVDETANLRAMFESGDPLVIDSITDYPGWIKLTPEDEIGKSFVGAPIRAEDDVIGFFTLFSHEEGFYTGRHAQRLKAFAEQAAVAIRNARLFESVQRHTEELEVLRQVTLHMTTELDLDVLLDRLVRGALQIVGADSGGMYLYRPERNALEWIVAVGKNTASLGAELKRGEGLSGRVWETGETMVVDNYSTWEGRSSLYDGYTFGMVLGVPVRWGDEFLGVINAVTGEDKEHRFSERDAELLGLFADHAAVAIKNAQLYRELENYSSILKQAVEEATAELQQSLEQQRAILDNSPDAIFLLGPDGKIETGNPAVKSLFAYDATDLVGHPPMVLLEGSYAERLADALSRVQANRQTERLDVLAKSRDGTTFDAEVALAPVEEEDGTLLGVVCAMRDVSAQKEIARMKDDFVSTAAHELRTPLTSIRGFSEILLTRQLEAERQRRYLGFINEQSTKIARLIDELLDLSRLEAGVGLDFKPEPLDVAALVSEVVEPFLETSAGHKFVIRDLADIPPVHGDPFRLAQVIRNLVSNAVKYSPDGSTITIWGRLEAERLVVNVSDEGRGIRSEQQKNLFEKFYRVGDMDSEGTGLGLAISKLIVEQHGGEIWMTSEYGVGSTFSFTVPLAGDGVPSRRAG
jgi:PAS domain S-box-containing protein